MSVLVLGRARQRVAQARDAQHRRGGGQDRGRHRRARRRLGLRGRREGRVGVAGVNKVLVADAPHYKGAARGKSRRARRRARAGIHAPARTGDFLCKNVAPRIAALLDVAQVSDIVEVKGADTFVRPIYAGNALATVQSLDRIKVVTVRTTGFDAVSANGGSGAVESVAAAADTALSSLVGARSRSPSGPS